MRNVMSFSINNEPSFNSGFYPDWGAQWQQPPEPMYYPEPSAPPLFPEPSAPPLSPRFGAKNLQFIHPAANPNFVFEECAICLESNADHPEGKVSLPRVIAATECNHFFHDFCLRKFFETGLNHDCPMCRNPLTNRQIHSFDLDSREPIEQLNEEPIDSHATKAAAPCQVEEPVQHRQNESNVLDQSAMQTAMNVANVTSSAFLLIGKGAWFIASTAAKASFGAANFVGSALLNVASEIIWPKVVDPIFIQICSAKAKSLKDEVCKRVKQQNDAIQLLLTQISSVQSDNTKNPAATFKKVMNIQDRLTMHTEAYLRKTESLMAELHKLTTEV